MAQKHIFVALTGASGSMYGLRLAEQLCLAGVQVTFSASCSGTAVCREETGLDLSGDLDKALQRLYNHLEINSGICWCIQMISSALPPAALPHRMQW